MRAIKLPLLKRDGLSRDAQEVLITHERRHFRHLRYCRAEKAISLDLPHFDDFAIRPF